MFQPGQNESVQIDEIARHVQGGDHPFVGSADQAVRTRRHAAQHHAAAFCDPVDGDDHLSGGEADMLGAQGAKTGQIAFGQTVTSLKEADKILGNRHSAPPSKAAGQLQIGILDAMVPPCVLTLIKPTQRGAAWFHARARMGRRSAASNAAKLSAMPGQRRVTNSSSWGYNRTASSSLASEPGA